MREFKVVVLGSGGVGKCEVERNTANDDDS